MNHLVLFLFSVCFGKGMMSALERTTYVAGVVEYHQPEVPLYDAIDLALEAYEYYMDEAKTKSVDILVFPESTVNYHPDAAVKIPPAVANENPCDEPESFSKILERLSCAAKRNNLYVVANLAERSHFCDEKSSKNCTNREDFLFNTNIVLDRKGTIISRYRKINLHIEPGFTSSLTKDLGVFGTDFGVTFGHLICSDIMFQHPAMQLVQSKQIRNIAFTTMWFSQLPFYAATAVQESWAGIHNVNLLAAGANNVKLGNTGTGIYTGKKGMQVGSMSGTEQSRMFVLELLKDPDTEVEVEFRTSSHTSRKVIRPDPETMDSLHLHQGDLTLYSNKELRIKESQNISVQNNDMKCEFFVEMKIKTPKKKNTHAYTYQAVVFDGVQSITKTTTAGIANCGIVACLNSSLASCGLRFLNYSTLNPSIEITNIELAATILKPVLNTTLQAKDSAYGPMVLDTSVMSIGIDEYEYSAGNHPTDSKKQILTMKLKKPQTELLTFGIIGRVFKKDGLPASTSVQVAGHPLIVVTFFLILTTMF